MTYETDSAASAKLAGTSTLDVSRIRTDFPVLGRMVNGHRLVYLDNAATSQKPKSVIDAHSEYYSRFNANIHRGLHTLAEEATSAYEDTRKHVANFIGGVDSREIIFTNGTTEAINLVAQTWGEQNIGPGDEILITEMEHHANLVPWLVLSQKKQAVLKRIPLTGEGRLDLGNLDNLISDRTKLVAISHMSNVLGTINPVKHIGEVSHSYGALVLIDGAQATPHMPINVKDLGADLYTFSAHKMLGPTGVGVLWGRADLLEAMPPFNTGGEMIREVHFDRVSFNELPHKFEAGTPNIAGVVAFDRALTYLEELGMENVRQHEIELSGYAIKRLLEIDGIEIQGPLDPQLRGGAISFTDATLHPHDISTFLDSKGIAIRAGHHCAQPLMRTMGKLATARASLYIYNDKDDIDVLVQALREMRRYFGL
ncbi:MAG: cysteine desulfurase [Candidatus Zixiibacteriota bacterium]|nr:MAG: cysteine desulfurase [candidate division Zixibacteria bacterium]